MSKYEKNRTLALYNILNSYTDDDHKLSMNEIRYEMDRLGYSCSEDSIFRYMNQLRNELGIDIISERGRNARYFIGSRILDKQEIQLIVDAINSSTAIDINSTKRIINKLKKLTSVHIAKSFERTILSAKNKASQKRNIIYRISEIQEALDANSQISFEYMDWNIEKKLTSVGEKIISPWGLIWANERYYLYGYTVKDDESEIEERTYRVDKIKGIKLLRRPRQGAERFKAFDVFEYVSRRIDMYSTKEERVTVRIPKNLVGIFIDRFGEAIEIREVTDGIIDVSFYVACSNYFLGWLLGIGNIEIIEPLEVKDKMIELLKKGIEVYEK
ncbi:helix-turn-helix transcriptional regulator [Pseudobutyrivibrio sp.]|uniref:helix-turn-helix transcriptional regulator n=1 Tax=Pseudobutyrivibrio sp. TaxID=2014367 RepID=UPI001DC60A4C|nr:WYL domain-containing protein [Pseudobutyrivibrio sp.]MBE5912271.1 WYL domain-containing protein [Pseudobutyrivibrio sp.]